MKELLAVISLLASGILGEAPAPYPPSGWRPNGPAFDLPQQASAQTPRKQEYLPPVDPRRPAVPNDFDAREEDVSVQGLPTGQEQRPLFQLSPVNGQQYVGPSFNSDIKSLDQGFKQTQFQLQQEKARQFARQRQLEASQSNNGVNRVPSPQVPRQFVPRTTTSPTESTFTTPRDEFRTTQFESTTESFELNEGETLDDDKQPSGSAEQQQKVSVEVSRQNLQEYPAELFLNPLAQFKLQPQFVPLQQLGQIRAPVFFQPAQQDVSQKQIAAGYDAQAHFSALPSILAQRQVLLSQPQGVIQSQQSFVQNPALLVSAQEQPATSSFVVQAPEQQPLNQYQPLVSNQYQPLPQGQVQVYPQPQQPAVLPAAGTLQPNQYAQPRQPDPENDDDDKNDDQNQTQFVYQQSYQPQEVYQQPFPVQPQISNYPQEQQSVLPQVQLANFPNQDLNQYYQSQLFQQQQFAQGQVPQQQVFQGQLPQQQVFQGQLPQQQVFQGQVPQQQGFQGQDAFLQSGLDINQQGNGIEQSEDKEDESQNDSDQDDGSTATAVATAFGARTQPRVFSQYGAPFPVPRAQANPGFQTTTESGVQNDETTEDEPSVAEATAVARGNRRKSAKLRMRRLRPVFTLDRSGHLVLAQDQ